MAGRGQSLRTCRSKQTNKKTVNTEETPNKTLNRSDLENADESFGDLGPFQCKLDSMSSDLGQIKADLKAILKKEDVEKLIAQTVKDVVLSLEEQMKNNIMTTVNEKCEHLQSQIESVTFENNLLKDRMKNMDELIENNNYEMKEKIKENLQKVNEVTKMANYNEQYSRKNNFKIMDIVEENYETEEVLTEKVSSVLNKQGVNLSKEEIIAIHRLPTKKSGIKPVIIKTVNNNVKSRVMRKRKDLKNAGNRIVDDVTKMNTGLINRLFLHEQIQSAWFFNGSVFGLTHENERIKFNLFENIRNIITEFRSKRNKTQN